MISEKSQSRECLLNSPRRTPDFKMLCFGHTIGFIFIIYSFNCMSSLPKPCKIIITRAQR